MAFGGSAASSKKQQWWKALNHRHGFIRIAGRFVKLSFRSFGTLWEYSFFSFPLGRRTGSASRENLAWRLRFFKSQVFIAFTAPPTLWTDTRAWVSATLLQGFKVLTQYQPPRIECNRDCQSDH